MLINSAGPMKKSNTLLDVTNDGFLKFRVVSALAPTDLRPVTDARLYHSCHLGSSPKYPLLLFVFLSEGRNLYDSLMSLTTTVSDNLFIFEMQYIYI